MKTISLRLSVFCILLSVLCMSSACMPEIHSGNITDGMIAETVSTIDDSNNERQDTESSIVTEPFTDEATDCLTSSYETDIDIDQGTVTEPMSTVGESDIEHQNIESSVVTESDTDEAIDCLTSFSETDPDNDKQPVEDEKTILIQGRAYCTPAIDDYDTITYVRITDTSESKWPYTAIACYKYDEMLFTPVKVPDGMIISSVVSHGKYLALIRSADTDMNQLYYLNTGAEIPLGVLSGKKLALTPYIENDRIFVYTSDKLDVTFFKIGLSDGKIDEIGTYDLSPYLTSEVSSASVLVAVICSHYDVDRNVSKLGGMYKDGETSIILACVNDGMLTVWDQGVVFDIQNDIITFSKMQDQH